MLVRPQGKLGMPKDCRIHLEVETPFGALGPLKIPTEAGLRLADAVLLLDPPEAGGTPGRRAEAVGHVEPGSDGGENDEEGADDAADGAGGREATEHDGGMLEKDTLRRLLESGAIDRGPPPPGCDSQYFYRIAGVPSLGEGTPVKRCRIGIDGYQGAVWPLAEYILCTRYQDGSYQECAFRRIDPNTADTKALLQHNPLARFAPPSKQRKVLPRVKTPDNFRPNLKRYPSSILASASASSSSSSATSASNLTPLTTPNHKIITAGAGVGAAAAAATSLRVPSLLDVAAADQGSFGQQLLVPRRLRRGIGGGNKGPLPSRPGWPGEILAQAAGQCNASSDFQVAEENEGDGFYGDDAYFWARLGEEDRAAQNDDDEAPRAAYFGLFDGVDVWREAKIAPRHYSFSHVLGCYARDRLLAYNHSDAHRLSSALEGAVQRMIRRGYKGSCTALVGAIDLQTGVLTTVSLGDTIFMVLREGRVWFRLPSLEIEFNCPLQVGHHPQASNVSKDALTCELQLIPGDIVVAGTDGLWDNLDAETLDECVETAAPYLWKEGCDGLLSEGQSTAQQKLKVFADNLVGFAAQNARNANARTPWSIQASREYGKRLAGGKPDDIAAVVLTL